MADEITSTAPTGGGEASKIKAFVKKNKTLTIVAGLGGIYYLVKKSNEGGGEAAIESTGEYSEEGATPLNEIGSVDAREEYNELTAEERERRAEEETDKGELNRQREEEIREREEEVGHMEEETSANTPADNAPENSPEPGEPTFSPEPTIATPKSASWSAHGREFSGATSGRIAATGKQGEKAYVEYAITFPGKTEHWRYFTGSGNWENVSNSAAGPTSGGGNGTKAPSSQKSGGNAIGNAQAVSAAPPQNNPRNPKAINTGNRCVMGGVGSHAAPAGWHLFCEDGWVWRAPNGAGGGIGNPNGPAAGGGGGGSGGGGGGGSAPSCPQGTVNNIHNARNEVNRLTGEIQQLQGYIQQHPNAQQRGGWENNISSKKATRDQFQGAVDRGRQQPGCGNV